MESPKTYYGFDETGGCVSTAPAKDANNDINPSEVQAAINNLKNVFSEQLTDVARELRAISQDADEAIIVQGTSMAQSIEDAATLLTQLPTQVTAGIDDLYGYAVEAHDHLQTGYNNKAYAEAASHPGVVRVSG